MTQYVAYVVVYVFIDEWMGMGGEERERDTDILLEKKKVSWKNYMQCTQIFSSESNLMYSVLIYLSIYTLLAIFH